MPYDQLSLNLLFDFRYVWEQKKDTKVYNLKEARQKIEHYCAYQERSHKQVQEKLLSFGLIPDVADELVIELIQGNFLNEARFASAFTRGRFNIKGWGKIKIKQHLKMHQTNLTLQFQTFLYHLSDRNKLTFFIIKSSFRY